MSIVYRGQWIKASEPECVISTRLGFRGQNKYFDKAQQWLTGSNITHPLWVPICQIAGEPSAEPTIGPWTNALMDGSQRVC